MVALCGFSSIYAALADQPASTSATTHSEDTAGVETSPELTAASDRSPESRVATVAGVSSGIPAEQQPSALGQSAAVLALRNHIEQLESEHGPYNPLLIEALGDLGSLYQTLGQSDEAVEVLNRALHVVRASEGLYSEIQLRLLRQLIDGNYEGEDWQAVDDNHHLAYFISSRLYEPGSPEHISAVLQLGDWKVHAYRRNLLGTKLSHGATPGLAPIPEDMAGLLTLYQEALAAAEEHEGNGDEARFQLLYGRAQAELEIASLLTRMPLRYFDTYMPRYTSRTVCRNVGDQNGNVQRVCWSENVENPNYREAQRDGHRREMDRARQRLAQSIDAMEELLKESKALPDHEKASMAEKVDKLQVYVAQLQRDSRRALIRAW